MARIKKQMRTMTGIESLPQHLIVEIIARLVSRSPTPVSDLQNVRMTCKMFRTVSKNKYIGRHIALKKERSLRWWNKRHYFDILERCAAAGNTEACFLLGLENVFDLGRMSLGLSYLEKAMLGGYDAATYTMGILLFGDHRTHEMGMDLLNKIRTTRNLYTVRKDVAESVRRITMERWSPGQTERCTNPTCGRVKGWDQRQSFCSDNCRWTAEYNEFYTKI